MTTPFRVLLVEDDPDDAELLALKFVEHGQRATIARVDTIATLERELARAIWDVVISDHRLPGFSSLEALEVVRARVPDMPFVIVSGQIGEELAVEALKAGADDYVMKDRLGRVARAVERAIADRRLRRVERESAEALRVAQAHLQWLVVSSPVVVYETDVSVDQTLRFVTDNVTALTGRDAGALVGRRACDWRQVHPDDAPALAEALARLSLTHAPQRHVYRCRHADGSHRWVQDDVRCVPGADGGAAALVGALVDVTDQRALEEQLHRAQRMEAVGQLAGGVAHDFNNLLAVILGCSDEVLARVRPDEPHHASALAIKRAAGRGAAVASRLLALSRRQVLRPRVRDLNAIVRDVEPLMRAVFSSRVTIDVVYADRETPVCVDEAQMEQVILNLVINARDATPSGGSVVVTVAPSAPGQVTLSVTDTGAGIDPAVRARIFEPFFTTKAPGTGTGLGLAMVQSVVAASGGEIVVDSEPGCGTCMSVRLPIALGVVPRAPRPDAPGGQASAASVLLVDDDDLVRDLIRRTLVTAGHAVETAESGAEALRCHDAQAPVDLLVTDLTMPGLGGVELARQLVARQPDLKVLFVSGCSEDVLPELPAHEFLAKPFEGSDLLAAVDRLLGPTRFVGTQAAVG